MNLLSKYMNGNYSVEIYDDGTKVRETQENSFISKFPECMDIKITNYCDAACPYCHENSTVQGKHGDILNKKFISSIQPFTEIAIGGGNPLSHPDLEDFLIALKNRNIIANMTVNQRHLIEDFETSRQVEKLLSSGLITGLGVSLSDSTDVRLYSIMKNIPNSVLHVINGILTKDDIKNLIGKNLKILILGYKDFRRGATYHNSEVDFNKQGLYNVLPSIIRGFKVVSFDNLAIKQLDPKRFLNGQWDEFYMGDDGQFTMYIDLVEQNFAMCSIAKTRYEILDDIVDMFNVVKQESR